MGYPFANPIDIYRAVLEHAIVLVSVVAETDEEILEESRSVGSTLGFERHYDRIGRRFSDFLHPEDVSQVRAAFREAFASLGVSGTVPCRILRRDESWLPIELVVRCVVHDERRLALIQSRVTSERRELDLCRRHVERLNAIGRMSVALAHDFDRLLGAMQGHLKALPVEAGQPSFLGLRAVRNAVERGKSLVRQFLLFGHMAPAEARPVDVNDVLNGLAPELVRFVGDTVKVIVASKAERAVVSGDRSRLEQVLMNLVLTLCDSISSGGVVVIGARNVTLADEMLSGEPREYVVIEIAHEGADIAARARLVDPYMATPDSVPSRSLWLIGRAMMHDTVQGLGGFIHTETVAGGLAFRIHLPWMG